MILALKRQHNTEDHEETQPMNVMEIDGPNADLSVKAPLLETRSRGCCFVLLFVVPLASALSVGFAFPFLPHRPFFSTNMCLDNLRDSTKGAVDNEPNPPVWPRSVILITPDMSTSHIQALVAPTQDPPHDWHDFDHASPEHPNGPLRSGFDAARHFVEERYAILVAPGVYKGVNVEIGYYVQLAGLGARADQVVFTDCELGPYVPALDKFKAIGGRPGLSLDTFWRAAENYQTFATQGQLWAVSQAAPLRRVHVAQSTTTSNSSSSRTSGNLYLHDNGAQASGGHLANAIVEGVVDFGSQQQWCARSVNMTRPPQNGAWSLVFVDCVGEGVPSSNTANNVQRNPAISVVHNPRVTVEKPFIAMENDGTYKLRVPAPRFRHEAALGPDLDGESDSVRDFSAVRVAVADQTEGVPDLCVAQKINQALAEGKDVVLSPGVYHLSESLRVTHNSQVILGLGLATLLAPTDGSSCVTVAANLQGVRLAGFMVEASAIPEKKHRNFVASLIEWGDEDIQHDKGNSSNPGVLSDIFARVGGSNLNRRVSTDVMVRIHSGNVVGDNLWLWRADHVKLRSGEAPNFPPLDYHQVELGECPCETGIVVNGDNVTMHGLAVEHTTQHQTIWNGNFGSVLFYQSELPYEASPDFGLKGYVGYKVGDQVTSHVAQGVGIYSNFRDHAVPVRTAITHPKNRPDIRFKNAFTVLLNNHGLIESVINGEQRPYDGRPHWGP